MPVEKSGLQPSRDSSAVADGSKARIPVASIEEFRAKEPRIVELINSTPHGGELFLCDPLRFLAEIGVALQPDVRKKIEVELDLLQGSPTAAAYDAIRSGEFHPAVRVNVKGILRRPSRREAK